MKYIYSLILLSLAAGASAQTKINTIGRAQLERYRTELSSRSSQDATTATVGAILRLNDGFDSSCLSDPEITVTADLGDMLLITAPVSRLENIAGMKQVKSLSFGGKRRLHMNNARLSASIDEAHTGIGSNNTTYTGSGVILGIMDGGLDPNHINFKHSDGSSRVQRLWHFTGQTGRGKEYTSSTIASFTTDDDDETHATHVAGIMAGSYRGTGTYMKQNPSSVTSGTTVNGNIPFYGVAPDAELALGCGDLYDANILAGIQNIMDYAESQGKPVAVNLSLGSNYGPHDGTDDFSVALDRLGQRGIICVSAGNEGADRMSIEKTLTPSSTTIKTVLFYNNYYANNIDGYLDIWASDSRPLTVTISTCSSTGTLTKRAQTTRADQTLSVGGVKSGGKAIMYSALDANNGRYNVLIDFYKALPTTGRFAITVEGQAGQTVNMYFHGYTEFTDRYSATSAPFDGFTEGSPDNSINAIGCGQNVITVGAYTTCESWKDLSGQALGYGEKLGDITSYSSYGHDFYGRQLPHVAAPGSAIASSYSRRFVAKGYESESAADMVGRAANGSATDYWGMMQGTSMSCPFMTGTVGLWLQADPTLTVSDVINVINRTSANDTYTSGSPQRFGAGKVDAAAGLRYILGQAAIGTVTHDGTEPILITPVTGGYSITMPGEHSFGITLTDIQGRTVATARGTDGQAEITTGHLRKGIYILSAQGSATSHSRKISVQ